MGSVSDPRGAVEFRFYRVGETGDYVEIRPPESPRLANVRLAVPGWSRHVHHVAMLDRSGDLMLSPDYTILWRKLRENRRYASGVIAARNSPKVIDFLTAFKAAPREPGYPLIDRNLSNYLKTERGVVVANLDKTQHDWPYRFGPRPLTVFAMDATFAYEGIVCGLHGVPKDWAVRIMRERVC